MRGSIPELDAVDSLRLFANLWFLKQLMLHNRQISYEAEEHSFVVTMLAWGVGYFDNIDMQILRSIKALHDQKPAVEV